MEDTLRISEETILLRRGIDQLNAGDTSVRGELLNIACKRLMRLTSLLRRQFQGLDGDQPTEDVFRNASLRLYQALHDTPIKDVRHFYRMAAIQIRRELIELCRIGQEFERENGSDASNDGAAAGNPSQKISTEDLRQWVCFHDSVDALPEDQREVFELIWYHEMSRGEAADLLGTSVQDVRRLWRSARLSLHRLLGSGSFPPNRMGD